jgi:hypothetical protein
MMAYIRDSCSGFVTGLRQAATAASPAYAFHRTTALERGWERLFASAVEKLTDVRAITDTTAAAAPIRDLLMKDLHAPWISLGVSLALSEAAGHSGFPGVDRSKPT